MSAALRNVALTALLAVASAVTSGALSLTDATAFQPAGAEAQPEPGRAQEQLAAARIDAFPTPETATRRSDRPAGRRDEACCAIRLDDDRPSHDR